jgi:hypothetical protein
MLREPMSDSEPVAFAVRGHFAHGYLKREAGLHRLRQGNRSSVARVTVAPWSGRPAPLQFGEQRALKASGQLGGKIRSRVSVADARLVLQNGRTLSENRELARDIAPSWPREQAPTATRVRLYDLDKILVRDYLTKSDFTRKEVLSPEPFHGLLCARLDAPEQSKSADAEAAAD